MKFSKKLILGLLVVIIAVVIYFVFIKDKTSTPSYQTGTVQKGTLINTVTSSGKIAATNSRTVTTTASGVVKKVYVTEGQKVKVVVPRANTGLNLFEEELTVNEFGTVFGDLQIPNNYFNSLQVEITADDKSISSYNWVTVTPYSKPQCPAWTRVNNARWNIAV